MNASNSQGGVRKRGRRKSRLQKLAEYIKQARRENLLNLLVKRCTAAKKNREKIHQAGWDRKICKAY